MLVFQVSCQGVLRIGIDANTWGESVTGILYNYTFEVYLNEQLKGTSYTFQTVLFDTVDDFAAAGLNHSVDIFLTGPGMFVCLQVSYWVTDLATGTTCAPCADADTVCSCIVLHVQYCAAQSCTLPPRVCSLCCTKF